MRASRFCSFLLFPAALACAASQLSRAQQPVQLLAGQRVRVTAPSAGLNAEHAFLLAAASDTLIVGRTEVRSDAGAPRVDTVRTAVPIASLVSLEVLAARRSHALAYGAGGAVVGAGALYLLVKALERDQCGWTDYFCIDRSEARGPETQALVAGAVLGTVAGVLLGRKAAAERWEQVPLGAGVVVVPLGDARVGVGASGPLGGSKAGADAVRPHRLWLGVGGGVGAAILDWSCCLAKKISGMTGMLQVGSWIGSHLSLGAEASAWSSAARGGWDHLEAVYAVALLYPSERSGLFLKGGYGAFIPGIEETSASSPGFVLGLGLDLRRGPGFTLRPYANYVGSTKTQAMSGAGVGTIRLSMVQLGVAAVWR